MNSPPVPRHITSLSLTVGEDRLLRQLAAHLGETLVGTIRRAVTELADREQVAPTDLEVYEALRHRGRSLGMTVDRDAPLERSTVTLDGEPLEGAVTFHDRGPLVVRPGLIEVRLCRGELSSPLAAMWPGSDLTLDLDTTIANLRRRGRVRAL